MKEKLLSAETLNQMFILFIAHDIEEGLCWSRKTYNCSKVTKMLPCNSDKVLQEVFVFL